MAYTRVVRNAAHTLSHTFYVDETATDPTGTPTYAVVDANGTSVGAGNASIVGGSTGRLTAALTSQSSTKLLTATWVATVAGSSVTEVDTVEVIDRFYFTLAEGRGSDASLADTSIYPTATLRTIRDEVEMECEAICDRAYVARYARVVLNGSGTSDLMLTHPDPTRSVADVRSIRRVSVAPSVDQTFVDFTAAELADVAVYPDGTLVRTGGSVFTYGFDNVVVEYEYGLTDPPPDLKRGVLLRFRSRLNMHRSGIPERASSFTIDGGGTYRLDMPGAWKTGVPDVDAIYDRYSRRKRNGPGGPKAVPASRLLNFDPQYYSLFHGGRR